MQSHPNAMLQSKEAAAFTGNKYSTFYAKIADGLCPKGIGVGGKTKAWPVRELEAVNQARIAGKTDDEIRALVVKLETERTGVPATPRRKPLERLDFVAPNTATPA